MKIISIIAFAIAVLAQWLFPANMVWQQERVLRQGKAFKFRVAPIDPADPFRGKYIALSFRDVAFETDTVFHWDYYQPVFVRLETDEQGFAKIANVTKEKPKEEVDFVPATVTYTSDQPPSVTVEYPFTVFYMEETKAPRAEQLYWEAARDTNQVAYAVVKVHRGRAALSDVVVNGESIVEMLNKQ